jgi:DNA polymerase-1
MSSESPLERILSRLEGVEETSDGSYKALCPAHDDHDPSLSITKKEDHKPLVHCFVCKDQEKVLRALEERGMSRSNLFHGNGTGSDPDGNKKPKRRMCLTGVYDYKTPDGEFVKHHSLRFEPPTKDEQHHPKCRGEHCYSNRKDKDFRQARPNSGSSGYVYGLDGVQTVPYNLSDVMRASLDGEVVVWVEGEKDADNGKERLGLTTTTCPMGAKHFKPHYAGYFTGAHVVIVADNDAPGRDHAEMVARELLPFAASVKVLKRLPGVPEGGDLTDWIDAGGTSEEFERLSSLSQPYIAGGDGDDLFGAVRFTDLGEPEPRTFVVEDVVPQGHSILLHGGGGSAKSILADLLGISISSGNLSEFLGHIILGHGPVLIIDFELDVDEQHRRVKALCGGLGIAVPDDLYYLSGLGMNTREVFERAVKVCEKLGVVFAVVDSIGFAMRGDMESSRDVNTFFAEYVDSLRAIGVTPMIIDHQGKLQTGESYQRKTAFGSAFKEHRARSILQVEAVENNRDAGTLRVRIRHKKANFSARLEPFDVEITFSEGRIDVNTVELTAADNASEEALSTTERIRLALTEGNKTSEELSEYTGLSRAYLQNILPNLEREGTVRVVKREGRTNTYGLPPEPPDDDGSDGDGDKVSENKKPPGERSEEGEVPSGPEPSAADTSENLPSPSPPYIPGGDGDYGEEGGAEPHEDEISTRHHSHLITSSEDLEVLIRDLSSADGVVALDIETCPPKRALDPRNGSIRLISLATGDLNKAVDLHKVDPAPLLEVLKTRTLVFFNARFDLSFLKNVFGYEHEGEIRDLLLMHLVNNFAAGKRVEKKGRKVLEDPDKTQGISDLVSVAKLYFGETLDKSQQDSDWSTPNLSGAQIAYALKDTGILLRLEEALEARLCELGLLEVVDIENRALLGVTWAENNGMPFDEEAWLGIAEENATEAERLKAEINPYAPSLPKEGKEWNWNSGPQTVEALELLGYDTSKLPRTDSGKPSVSESALKSIKSPTQAREFVQAILHYRGVQKLVSTYGKKWIKPARPTDHERVVDGRVHTSYRQIVSTGRMASRKPNLQNLPRDPRFRRAFRAPEGRRLVVADYAQIELLFGAIISGDESMLEALRNGENLHLKTARVLTSDRELSESELKEYRKRAKVVNFGFLYGMGARRFVDHARDRFDLEVTLEEAKRYREAFFETYPGIRQWHYRVGEACNRGEDVAFSLLGRPRKLDLQKGRYTGRYEPVFTEATNHPVQGSAADALKLTIARLWETRDECPGNPLLVGMVHDEIILEVDEDHCEEATEWLMRCMSEAVKEVTGDPETPVVVEIETRESWGE